ncbi:MAG: hypothetical protein H7A38_03090 [Chlamydiales bacterium]|nr:hypothetical protein [Chlamydiales bacterium]
MSKPVSYQDTLQSYYTSAQQLPSTAKNYLNRQVETLQGYGTSAYEYGAQKMDQIRAFGSRAQAAFQVVDKTAEGSYKGMLFGALLGFFTPVGLFGGAYLGTMLGGMNAFSNAMDQYDQSVLAQNS